MLSAGRWFWRLFNILEIMATHWAIRVVLVPLEETGVVKLVTTLGGYSVPRVSIEGNHTHWTFRLGHVSFNSRYRYLVCRVLLRRNLVNWKSILNSSNSSNSRLSFLILKQFPYNIYFYRLKKKLL